MLRKNNQVPNKYYVTMTIGILNTIGVVYVLLACPAYNLLCHLTLWGYYMNSAYILFNLINDTNFYILKQTNLESFNLTIRTTFGAIVNPFTYLICLLFWIILFIGNFLGIDTMGKPENMTNEFIFRNFYYHLFITFFILIDLKIEEHPDIKYEPYVLKWICTIFGTYCIVCLISIYGFNIHPYPFLGMGGIFMLIFSLVLGYILLIGCYFFHIFLIKKVNQYRREDKEKPVVNKDGFQQVITHTTENEMGNVV